MHVLRGQQAPIQARVSPLRVVSANRSQVLTLFDAKGYRVDSSAAPDAPLGGSADGAGVPEVSDFVAVPPSLIDSWQELRQEWRRRLS